MMATAVVKHHIKRLLGSAGYTLFNTRKAYARDGLLTVHYGHFLHDPVFREAYSRGVSAGWGVDPHFEWRVHVALWAAITASRAPGDFVECGVNAGFISSAIMQRLNWRTVTKQFYLVDTFNGPVAEQFSKDEVDKGRLKIVQDAIAAGAYVTDLERVRSNYSEWPNVVVVPGVVPDVLASLPIEQVAFLHLDMNCAYPERAALEFFWDRLSTGGVILMDDYCYGQDEVQAQAIDEVARRLGIDVLCLPTGQGLIMK